MSKPNVMLAASRAESGTDGQFLAAAFNAHKKQISDVGACNEQYDDDRTHQDPENVSDIANDIVLEGVEIGATFTFSKIAALNPSGAGKLWTAMGSRRSISVLACLKVTPGLMRAMSAKAEVAELGFAAIQSAWAKTSRRL